MYLEKSSMHACSIMYWQKEFCMLITIKHRDKLIIIIFTVGSHQESSYKLSTVGGRSLRPAWTAITEHIPFTLSNFHFKHIVKTGVPPDMTEREKEETRKRNREITHERHTKLKNLWNKAARWWVNNTHVSSQLIQSCT